MRRQPPQSVETAGEWLKMAFVEADRRVASLVNERGERMNAGSTSVAVMICGNKLQWGCVGDSSIYMMRNAHIEVVTRMHNYNLRLDEMFRRGEIDEEERNRQGARGEALISYLGIGYLPLIECKFWLVAFSLTFLIFNDLQELSCRSLFTNFGNLITSNSLIHCIVLHGLTCDL